MIVLLKEKLSSGHIIFNELKNFQGKDNIKIAKFAKDLTKNRKFVIKVELIKTKQQFYNI